MLYNKMCLCLCYSQTLYQAFNRKPIQKHPLTSRGGTQNCRNANSFQVYSTSYLFLSLTEFPLTSPHFISTQPRLYNRTQCPQMQINKSYPSILVIPLFVWINSTHQLKVTFWASSARRPVYNAEWNPSYGVSPTGTWGSKCLVVSQ